MMSHLIRYDFMFSTSCIQSSKVTNKVVPDETLEMF